MRCLLALAVFGCSAVPGAGGGSDDQQPEPDAPGSGSAAVSVFDPAIHDVIVEVDYETGQEPYTGPIVGFGDTFDPTQANLDRIFAGKKTLTIPRTTSAMQDIGPIADEEITVADILALAAQHRDVHNTETSRSYYVIFVSGYFADDSGVRPGVLGISIGDQIAMFKDVIESTNIVVAPNVVRYVEQSTLIHELSHSIGLTNNGVPMVAPHEDAAHRPHCDNPDCVMFWQNDGSSDATEFAQQKLLTGSSILFDDHCLADVDALN